MRRKPKRLPALSQKATAGPSPHARLRKPAPRGTPVLAAADGTVVYVGDKLQSYGNLVLIRHTGGMVTAYAHLNSVNVRQGAMVRRGQAIGAVGSTGTVANAQLHFEVRKGKDTLDPKSYLG